MLEITCVSGALKKRNFVFLRMHVLLQTQTLTESYVNEIIKAIYCNS